MTKCVDNENAARLREKSIGLLALARCSDHVAGLIEGRSDKFITLKTA